MSYFFVIENRIIGKSVMKKLAVIFTFVLLLSSTSVQARTIKVEALNNFSTQNAATVFSVRLINNETLRKVPIEAGTIISGQIITIEGPQRGKRDGYLEFMPTSWINNGKDEKIEMPYSVARVIGYKPVSPKDVTFNAARKIANFFLKGAISCAEFAQGAICAPKGEKFKTGIKKVYDDSFFVYIEVGKELNIHKGDILVFKLRNSSL